MGEGGHGIRRPIPCHDRGRQRQPRLAGEIDRLALLMQTISEAIGNEHHSKEDGIREHIEIIEALLAEDPERAARAMTRHIEAIANRALGVMFSKPVK